MKDPETPKYYRNLFMKYLEGKELSEELIDYLVNYPHKWLRNVFRHYMLEQLGWFSYGEPLLLELGEDYVSIRELSSNSALLRHGNAGRESRLIKAVVYGGEHVDEEDEDPYFYKPSNLY